MKKGTIVAIVGAVAAVIGGGIIVSKIIDKKRQEEVDILEFEYFGDDEEEVEGVDYVTLKPEKEEVE